MKGNVISFQQDLSSLAIELPRLPKDLSNIVLQCKSQKNLSFSINPQKVLAALEWLKKNNKYYASVQISQENVEFYQNNPTFELPSMLQDWDPYKNAEDKVDNEQVSEMDQVPETDLNGDWPRVDSLVQGDVETANNDKLIRKAVKNMGAPPPAGGDEETKFAWPERSKTAASEYEKGYYPKAFPNLFPNGEGDFYDHHLDDSASFIEYVRHLMNFHDDRFQRDELFL